MAWLRGELEHAKPSRARTWRVALIGALLWATPVVVVVALWRRGSVLAREGRFFSEAAVVTFGEAYAVLAFIAQRAVTDYGWLSPAQMLDGLALAETTPGPLIMVVQFVAFMAAFQHQTGMSPWLAGSIGSLLTVWVTFVPCLLWVFLGGPYIEALRGNRALHSALSAVTAAVVGVVLNLSVWFAEHTIFGSVREFNAGPIHLDLPRLATLNLAALVLAAGAMVAMLPARRQPRTRLTVELLAMGAYARRMRRRAESVRRLLALVLLVWAGNALAVPMPSMHASHPTAAHCAGASAVGHDCCGHAQRACNGGHCCGCAGVGGAAMAPSGTLALRIPRADSECPWQQTPAIMAAITAPLLRPPAA